MIVVLITVFSLTTILQSLFERFSINRLIGGIIAFLSTFVFLIKPQRKMFVRVMILLCIAIKTILVSMNIHKDVNDLIFLFTTVMLITICTQQSNVEIFIKSCNKNKKCILSIAVLDCIILLYLLITKTGYTRSWDGEYFLGLCNTQHTMGSVCCLVIALLFLSSNMYKRKWVYLGLLILIPAYALLETGARTFLIPLVIMCYLFISYEVPNKHTRVLICMSGICLAIIFFSSSGIATKFLYTANNNYSTDVISNITSGRSKFWIIDLSIFSSGNPIEWLIGQSFSRVYSVNLETTNMEIWAHNDIIHLLVGIGLVGTGIYLMLIFRVIKEMFFVTDSLLNKFLLALYIFFPMFFNGFFVYQHYFYSFLILFFIILIQKES